MSVDEVDTRIDLRVEWMEEATPLKDNTKMNEGKVATWLGNSR